MMQPKEAGQFGTIRFPLIPLLRIEATYSNVYFNISYPRQQVSINSTSTNRSDTDNPAIAVRTYLGVMFPLIPLLRIEAT